MQLTTNYKLKKPDGSDVVNIKDFNDNADILDNVIKTHTHTKSQITDMPSALKNPNALTLQFNGTTNKTYDGSSAQTVNITPNAIGAASTSQLGTLANLRTTEKSNIVGAINEVFQSASDGKTKIATAITGKGVSANSSDSYDTLASKITQITTGVNTSDATATASQILSGQTAYVNGTKLTGSMPNRGNYQIAKKNYFYTNSDGVTYLVNWIPGGFYNPWQQADDGTMCGESWIRQSDLINTLGITPDKIVAGNNICGVAGTAQPSTVKHATGTATLSSDRMYVTIPALSFVPKAVHLSGSEWGYIDMLSLDGTGSFDYLFRGGGEWRSSSVTFRVNAQTTLKVNISTNSSGGFGGKITFSAYSW